MAIEDTIHAIQQKPERVRAMYIVLLTTIIMTFVVILWIFSIRDSMTAIVEGVERSVPEVRDAQGQVGAISQGISDLGENIASFGNLAAPAASAPAAGDTTTPAASAPAAETAPAPQASDTSAAGDVR